MGFIIPACAPQDLRGRRLDSLFVQPRSRSLASRVLHSPYKPSFTPRESMWEGLVLSLLLVGINGREGIMGFLPGAGRGVGRAESQVGVGRASLAGWSKRQILVCLKEQTCGEFHPAGAGPVGGRGNAGLFPCPHMQARAQTRQ